MRLQGNVVVKLSGDGVFLLGSDWWLTTTLIYQVMPEADYLGHVMWDLGPTL